MKPESFHLTTTSLHIHRASLIRQDGNEYGFAHTDTGRGLLALLSPKLDQFNAFEGELTEHDGFHLLIGPLSPRNAAALRTRLTWLRPRPVGLNTSAGTGDRIGLATPGHVRAIRSTEGKIAPIFAQQSIREMSRTNRTPQQVLDDATWGIFQEGWQDGFGADADHLKTTVDIDACLAAGFTLFTVDPGVYVDNRVMTVSLNELRELTETLPAEVQPQASGLLGRVFDIENLRQSFSEWTLLTAALKYGRAIAHVATMYRHLQHAAGPRPFELEVSVDETEQPTTHTEHLYIASELRRLGVKWISLAPRFIGQFEKGVDYIGDPAVFESDLAGHAAIARQFGPYKLSLHSGSDKFSIYSAFQRQTHGLVHLKTAGTSYLEALRTIADLDANFFKEIYIFARQRFEQDKASYHVSAVVDRTPLPESVSNWPELLDQFDAREILHVTFGSVLSEQAAGNYRFRDRLIDLLQLHAEDYAANLERHFQRHLRPFCI